jgi:hypothetical protein
MCHKHKETKHENLTSFYFGLKNEQIKTTLKYLPTNNFLFVSCQLKRVSDETALVLTLKYSVHHAHRCYACKRMALWTCEGSMHFVNSALVRVRIRLPLHCSNRSWVSSGSIVSGYGLDDRGSIPGRGKGFFLYPLCPDRLWGPPSLLSNGYRGSFPCG